GPYQAFESFPDFKPLKRLMLVGKDGVEPLANLDQEYRVERNGVSPLVIKRVYVRNDPGVLRNELRLFIKLPHRRSGRGFFSFDRAGDVLPKSGIHSFFHTPVQEKILRSLWRGPKDADFDIFLRQ